MFDPKNLLSILTRGLLNANVLKIYKPSPDPRINAKYDNIFLHPLRNNETIRNIPEYNLTIPHSFYYVKVLVSIENIFVNNRLYSGAQKRMDKIDLKSYLELDHVPFEGLPEVRIKTSNVKPCHFVEIGMIINREHIIIGTNSNPIPLQVSSSESL